MKNIPFTSGRMTPKALSVWLVLFIFLVAVSLTLATAWQTKQSADERMANARLAVSNVVSAAEQHARDTVNQADNTLRNIAERIEVDGTDATQTLRLSRLMARNVEEVEGIQGLFIYDEAGNWIANSFSPNPVAKNNGDRDYFIYHRDNPSTSVHIGSLVVSRTTGDLIIPVSRRLQHADGRFAGVVLATIPVNYFQSFFERLNVDNKGVIFIALSNGDLLARRPTVGSLATTNIFKGEIFSKYLPKADSGTEILTSVVDGVERVYAYRRLQGLPIVTAAGLSCESVYAEWRIYVYRSFALVGLIISALALLGFMIYRQIQKLMDAESQLSAAHHELERMAHTDSLTTIANRRCFDEALKLEWLRAQRSQTRLGVILLDIDWFKQYNDHYGHVVGDDCLRQVARLIRATTNRTTDLAARYGGEEFVVLLPDTDLAGAIRVAEAIRVAIAAAAIEHVGSPLGIITISAGVVSTQARETSTPLKLLQTVDGFLYEAKRQGRNCIQHVLSVDTKTPSAAARERSL